jgi:DNA modification methylase
MQVRSVPIKDVKEYGRNSRTHSKDQVGQIAKSITEFGWTNPLLIDESGVLIAGHGRLAAAKLLAMDSVPCIEIAGLSDAKRRALVIADNKLAMNAGWDETILALELSELKGQGFDVDVIGFTENQMLKLIGFDVPGEGKTDDNALPDVPTTATSQDGDVWLCGDHRVMCGDGLLTENIRVITGGGIADMVWTDPPYLMDFTGAIGGDGSTRSTHRAIANDKLSKADGEKFLQDFTRQLRAWCQGAWYVTFYRLGLDWMFDALKANGLRYRNLIIWKKNHLNLSNSDYKSIYEPMILGWANDYQPIFYGWNIDHPWHGLKGETDVWDVSLPSLWEIERTKKNDLHPTMKPVELIVRSIQNSSKVGDTVLDFFGGSGSTLIAAEKTGRLARVLEIDQRYCDVIVRRWQDFTGKQATLEQSGATFEQVASTRLN